MGRTAGKKNNDLPALAEVREGVDDCPAPLGINWRGRQSVR